MTSFRSRILISFIISVSLISSVTFYLYSNYLSKRIYNKTEENTVSVLNILNEPSQVACNPHNSLSYKLLTEKLNQNKTVINAYFADNNKLMKYPETYKTKQNDSIFYTELKLINEKVSFKNFTQNDKTFSRAFIKIENENNCKTCHKPEIQNLGYFIFDFSINHTRENLDFTRKFSISFTFFLILILGSIVIFMHYKIVKSSLEKFKKTINIINNGNYEERVEIPKSKELGQLAQSFNHMIEKFQETKKQLHICHKKELDDKLKLATIGEMSARLAHELRNPITGIANAIEIIVEENKDDSNIQILEEIKRQANRVNNTITNLLKYSKTPNIKLEKADINSIIKSIVFFFENQALNKKIVFLANINEKIPEFYFDKEEIENCLLNISLNAVQAIDEKGYVKYSTENIKDKKLVLIKIENNGPEIPENMLNEIFKPFYTTKTEGTGLGLSITKDIVEKHNGTIKIESSEKNGTAVFIYLPYNTPQTQKNKNNKTRT